MTGRAVPARASHTTAAPARAGVAAARSGASAGRPARTGLPSATPAARPQCGSAQSPAAAPAASRPFPRPAAGVSAAGRPQSRAAAERVASARNAVIAEVASAWYELYYLGQSIEIVEGNRDLVLHLERVARARYGTGGATHSDVIRAQVELGNIENRLASLKDRQAPLFARLNSALNRPTTEPLALPRTLDGCGVQLRHLPGI